jgi:hypothetical protein
MRERERLPVRRQTGSTTQDCSCGLIAAACPGEMDAAETAALERTEQSGLPGRSELGLPPPREPARVACRACDLSLCGPCAPPSELSHTPALNS